MKYFSLIIDRTSKIVRSSSIHAAHFCFCIEVWLFRILKLNCSITFKTLWRHNDFLFCFKRKKEKKKKKKKKKRVGLRFFLLYMHKKNIWNQGTWQNISHHQSNKTISSSSLSWSRWITSSTTVCTVFGFLLASCGSSSILRLSALSASLGKGLDNLINSSVSL